MLIPALALTALLAAAPAKNIVANIVANPVANPVANTVAKTAAKVALPALPAAWTTAVGAGFRFADGLHAALRANDTRAATVLLALNEIGEVRVRLHRFEAASLDARVEIGAGKRIASTQLTSALRGVVHFDGAVDGYPHSSCYLAFATTGAAGWIDLGEGQGRFTLRRVASEAPGLCAGECEFVRSSGNSAPDVPLCGGALTHDGAGNDGGIAGFGAIAPGSRRVVELAIDSDWEYFHIFENTTSATEYVGTLVGAISAIYRRDCDASMRVSYIRLQTDQADIFNDPDPLGQFRDYWSLNGADVHRDLFTFLSGRRNTSYGGVAWLNAACTDYGYAVSAYINGVFADPIATRPGNWDINVVAHELGHNVGTLHTHDYGIDGCASGSVQRGTIMSYCHAVSGASANIDLRFHSGTAAPIETFLVSAPCIAVDCNDNAIDDAAEILANPALDTNNDGIIDGCQDCNGNGTPDPVEIAAGTVIDIDGDQRPDACEADCNGNGQPDSFDIGLQPGLDADGNFVLDSCQFDCNSNGVADSVEINSDMSLDRSRDGRIDACEDCDGDATPDFIELQGSKSRWVASANDALLRELDPRSGVLRRTVTCGVGPVSDLAIGADGRLYAAADNFIYALDRQTGTSATVWSVALSPSPRAIAVAPDGLLAVLLADGTVKLLNANGSIDRTIAVGGPPAGTPSDLVFRTLPGGGQDALVSFSSGVIRRVLWSSGAGSVFADRSASAPDFRGMFAKSDGSVLIATGTPYAIVRFDAAGGYLGEWDVENGTLVVDPRALCDAGDGHGVLMTGPGGSSTINGFNLASGYTERNYRVYGVDAPTATAIVVAPASATDANGDLLPDACQIAPADLNGDGAVNAADLALLLNVWGPCVGCGADLNHDATVGAPDLAMLLNAWH